METETIKAKKLKFEFFYNVTTDFLVRNFLTKEADSIVRHEVKFQGKTNQGKIHSNKDES
jgi:hypothetical protein